MVLFRKKIARTGKHNGSFRTIVRKNGVLVPGFEPGSKE